MRKGAIIRDARGGFSRSFCRQSSVVSLPFPRMPRTMPVGIAVAGLLLCLAAGTGVVLGAAKTPAPTPVPTPEPPPRVRDSGRKGAAAAARVNRFPSPEITFSRLLRVEEVDLDRDGEAEVLIEGIGTVKKIFDDTMTVDFVSRQRLPFESPI